MSGFSSKFALLLLAAFVCLSGLGQTASAQKGGVRKPQKKQLKKDPQSALPPYTPTPLQPLPLEQTPTVAPVVTLQGGDLTIVAHNSTLADVLRAVRKLTGADMEIPPNATERVVADIGPAPARDVLAQLLNGTHFNYVMVGSTTDPSTIQSIILTAKSNLPETASVAPPPRASIPVRGGGFPRTYIPPAGQQGPPQQAAAAQAAQDADDADDDADSADSDTADDQTQPPTPDAQNQQQTPKTPEQLLQELQRQQQQQQQQQQPPQPGQPPQGLFPNQPPTQAPNRPD